jgi:flagellar hook-associated protein 1
MSLGDQSARSDALSQVELSFAEPGDNGIASSLEKFWGAWGDVTNGPEGAAARQSLVDQSRDVAQRINDLQSSLAGARQRAADEYTSLAGAGGQVNQISTDLASTLNAIRSAEMTGSQPNDLYDRRDLLLDQLSGMGQVSVTQSPGGSSDVSLGGVTIVDADDTSGIATVPAGAFPLSFASSPGGRLGALLDLQSSTGPIASYQTDLAAMAKSLADSVNGIYGASGTDFFTYGTGASGLPELHLNEPAISATTLVGGLGGASDNSIALQIEDLRGGDADKRYSQLVTRMGNEVAQASRSKATAQVLTDNLSDRRESVSGVSLDEEMTNIIRFQRAYQASARAMSTTDEMLDTLINRAGRVGL